MTKPIVQTASAECRAILREPRYAPDTAAKLIEWLREKDSALADLAGRALAAMGTPSFDDLLRCVTESGTPPWPTAIWTLALFDDCHARLLQPLRLWLSQSLGELELQYAASLSHLLVTERRRGHPVNPVDIATCRAVLERDAANNPAIRVHLRGLLEGLELDANGTA